MSEKWELARYIIDAKKCVDSIMYISENKKQLVNIGLKEKTDSLRDKYYINCCAVLDKCFNKKELCARDSIAKSLYYERDKHVAHKDKSYKPKNYSSYNELLKDLKKQLSHVKGICKDNLPSELTLDFLSHDKESYRYVNSITPEDEERANKIKYPNRYNRNINDKIPTKTYNVFQDTEDLNQIENRNEYAVIFEMGINDNESLQNLQDSCIKLNVLHNTSIWCQPNTEIFDKSKKLREQGFIDKCGVWNVPGVNDKEACLRFLKIMSGKEE